MRGISLGGRRVPGRFHCMRATIIAAISSIVLVRAPARSNVKNRPFIYVLNPFLSSFYTMREKRFQAGIRKALAVLAVSFSLFRADPLVDRVEAKGAKTKAATYIVSCGINEKEEPRYFPHSVLSTRSLSVEFDLPASLNQESITLRSADPYFDGKVLGLATEYTRNDSYQYRAGANGLFEELILWRSALGMGFKYVRDPDYKTRLIGAGGCNSYVKTSTSAKPTGKSTDKPTEQSYQKGVFIRPCPGQFYDASTFEPPEVETAGPVNLAELKTAVGGGTLRKACEDLRDSGVTDIFLPFKVDDQESTKNPSTGIPECGTHGQLLYPSKEYKERVSEIIEEAQAATRTDPISSILSVCKDVYGDKTLRFHAWFPVFKDPYAARIQGVKGKLKFESNKDDTIVRIEQRRYYS